MPVTNQSLGKGLCPCDWKGLGLTSFEVVDIIGSQQVGLATDRTQQNMAVVNDLIKELRIGRIQMSLGRRKLFSAARPSSRVTNSRSSGLQPSREINARRAAGDMSTRKRVATVTNCEGFRPSESAILPRRSADRSSRCAATVRPALAILL